MIRVVVLLLMLAAVPAWGLPLSDPAYLEGYGKNTVGGDSQTTCTVTNSGQYNPNAAGTFYSCTNTILNGHRAFQNRKIQFSVDRFFIDQPVDLGSNVTIDGCANGQSGVVFDQSNIHLAATTAVLKIVDPVDQVKITCLNMRNMGRPAVTWGTTTTASVSIWRTRRRLRLPAPRACYGPPI